MKFFKPSIKSRFQLLFLSLLLINSCQNTETSISYKLYEIENLIGDLKFKKALNELDYYISKYDTISRLYALRAELLMQTGNWKQAGNDCKRAYQINKNDENVLTCNGTYFFKKNKLDKAKYFYDIVLSKNPEHILALTNLGLIFSKERNFDLALDYHNKAIETKCNLGIGYSGRGITYLRMKHYDKALADVDKGIELAGSKATKLISFDVRAFIYKEQEEFSKALKDYSDCIELTSNNPKYYFKRGGVYYRLKNYHKALKDYSKCIKLAPGRQEYYYQRGFVHYIKGDYRKALKDYEQAKKYGRTDSIDDMIAELKTFIGNK